MVAIGSNVNSLMYGGEGKCIKGKRRTIGLEIAFAQDSKECLQTN
jgi:hypothetical protein